MKRLALMTLLTGCAAYGGDSLGAGNYGPGAEFGATQGGVKDMQLARTLVKEGRVPPKDAFVVEGMFSEHDLPLSGTPCARTLCLRGALGVAPDEKDAAAAWLRSCFGVAPQSTASRRAHLRHGPRCVLWQLGTPSRAPGRPSITKAVTKTSHKRCLAVGCALRGTSIAQQPRMKRTARITRERSFALSNVRELVDRAILRRDRRGLAAVEYALLLAAILFVVAAGFVALGRRVSKDVAVADVVVSGGNGSVTSTGGGGAPGGGGASGDGDNGTVASVFNSPMSDCAGGVCTGPGNCFVAGTQVVTPAGLRAIETLKSGDLVLSRGAPEEPVVARPIARTFVRAAAELVDVGFVTIDGEHEAVRSTPEHAYWTLDRGWVGAGELVPGETVSDVVGRELQVDRVARIPGEATVYNFEVSEHHTYFVGHVAAWVHNMTCGTGTGGTTGGGGTTTTGGGGGTGGGGTTTGGSSGTTTVGPAPGTPAWANANWNSTGKLTGDGNFNGHFTKHQAEFPGMSKTDYANEAESLKARLSAGDPTLQSKPGAGGKTYIYDSAKNEFAVVQSSGKISTLFKPKAGQTYYNNQK